MSSIAADAAAVSRPTASPWTTRAATSQVTPPAAANSTRLTTSNAVETITTGLRPIASERSPKTSSATKSATA